MKYLLDVNMYIVHTRIELASIYFKSLNTINPTMFILLPYLTYEWRKCEYYFLKVNILKAQQ